MRPRVGKKVKVVEKDGSEIFGTIESIWSETTWREAGFRVELYYKSYTELVDFKPEHLGKIVFYVE